MENVTFDENSEGISFSYKWSSKDGENHCFEGRVRTDIVKKGEKAILAYVSRKVKKFEMEIIKRMEEVDERIRRENIPITTEYKNVRLEGRIVGATSRLISVVLDSPLKGESSMRFGAGLSAFTKDYEISELGYSGARSALCNAYNYVLRAPQRKLVERLNGEQSE